MMTWRKSARMATAMIVTVGASFVLATPGVAAGPSRPNPAAENPPNDQPGRGHAKNDGRSDAGDTSGSDDTSGSSGGTTDDTSDTTGESTTGSTGDSTDATSRGDGSTEGPDGDNGTVKVHRSGTPADDRRNEPKVCSFYLVGFGFDPDENVSWRIRSWPPTGDRTIVASGGLTLDESGHGRTADMSLSDGHYKLFWNFEGEKGRAKWKVFWVKCPAEGPTESPSPSVSPTTAAPVPTETAPGAQPPAEEAPTKNRGANLPFTGFPLWAAAALAMALLAGGSTIVWAARKRT